MRKFALCVSLILLFSMVSCGTGDLPELTKLSVPEITEIHDNTVNWNSVPNAASYVVKIDTQEYSVIGLNYTIVLSADKTVVIMLKAKSNDVLYTDSDWTEARAYNYIKPAPVSNILTPLTGDWNGENASWVSSNGVRTGQYYIELGEYPHTYVGDSFNISLESVFNNIPASDMVITDKNYTSNSSTDVGTYVPKTNPEYSYLGMKYVRISVLEYNYSVMYTFSNSDTVPTSGATIWLKVEPIKWIIANWDRLPTRVNPSGSSADNEMLLVASDIVTGGIPFGPAGTTPFPGGIPTVPAGAVLWQESMLRMFLNDKFYYEAFTTNEHAAIVDLVIPNNMADGSNPQGNPSTQDKIFLPSYYEVFNASGSMNNLFNTSAKRTAKISDWALANFTYMYTDENYGRNSIWWLRSAEASSYVYHVGTSGVANGYYPYFPSYGVRPALALALS